MLHRLFIESNLRVATNRNWFRNDFGRRKVFQSEYEFVFIMTVVVKIL